MPELIPEKRVDRNGRTVTRHVRQAPAARASKAAIPPPATTPATRAKRLPVARTRPFLWDVYKSQCGADNALVIASKPYAPDLNYYFEASDEDAYNVMHVVSPKNIIPLLACGIKTSDDAIAFLKKNKLSRLIEDNSMLAQQALSRNIPAQSVKSMVAEIPEASIYSPTFFDAMAVIGVRGYRDAFPNNKIAKLVLEGRIKLDDLKTVGSTRIRAGGIGSAILSQLEKINTGQSKMDAEELAQVISKASAEASNTAMVNEAVWLADKLGPQLVLELNNPSVAAQLDNSLIDFQYDRSKADGIIRWNDKVRSYEARLGYIPVNDLIELFEAGIEPEAAASGIRDKLPVHQIVGIHKQGIQPAVSSGWL